MTCNTSEIVPFVFKDIKSDKYNFRDTSLSLYEVVSIDTEYTDHFFLSLQIYVKSLNEKVFIINNNLYNIFSDKIHLLDKLKSEFEEINCSCTKVLYMNLDCELNENLNCVLSELFKEHDVPFPKLIVLLLYYSVKDLYASFGYIRLKEAMLANSQNTKNINKLYHQNNLKGQIFNKTGSKYKIFDVYGFVSNSSIKDVADSVGIPMKSKTLLHSYKKNTL